MYGCSYCGSKYMLDEHDELVGKELTEAKIIALLEKSKQLHEVDNFSEELEVLIKAFEMDGNNSQITVKLGRCYRCIGLPDKAIECYKRTLELNPNEGTAYTNMGTIYLLREDYKEAAKYYEKGLPLIDKATFDYWIANANYAVAVAKLGDPKRAENMIRESEAHGYKNGEDVRKLAGIKSNSLFSGLRKLFS